MQSKLYLFNSFGMICESEFAWTSRERQTYANAT